MSKNDETVFAIQNERKGRNLRRLQSSHHDKPDLICLSHLRWDFVYQRPQHLLSRFANERRVFFVEEPVFVNDHVTHLDISKRDGGLYVVVPRLPKGLDEQEIRSSQQLLINELISEKQIRDYLLWYYTPMALSFTSQLNPLAIVYDCMDELTAFRGAPAVLGKFEDELLDRADLVFTGGQSLYEAKRHKHKNMHPFPSSIDVEHFVQARGSNADPDDQANIAHPRLGFFGVIDERMDTGLLGRIADARPDWQLVMIGPVVKIDPADLPRRHNIHYLGGKKYEELPGYLAGWDVALLPFALNDSTRFISPTKTLEYLSAGKPVVSTPIRDVVRPYGEMGLVRVANSDEDFIANIEASIRMKPDSQQWLLQVDDFLGQTSWDKTWLRMIRLIESAVNDSRRDSKQSERASGLKSATYNRTDLLSAGD